MSLPPSPDHHRATSVDKPKNPSFCLRVRVRILVFGPLVTDLRVIHSVHRLPCLRHTFLCVFILSNGRELGSPGLFYAPTSHCTTRDDDFTLALSVEFSSGRYPRLANNCIRVLFTRSTIRYFITKQEYALPRQKPKRHPSQPPSSHHHLRPTRGERDGRTNGPTRDSFA